MKDDEVKAIKLDGWPVPDEYLIELGRVSALWASLEQMLNLCIGNIAGFDVKKDPKWYILVTHASFPQRLDAFGAMCEIEKVRYPNLVEYQPVVTKLKNAQKLRNRYLHNQIGPDPSTGEVTILTSSARGILKFDNNKISLVDIRKAAIAIDEASRSIYKLVFKREIPPIWERKKNGHVWE